MGKSAYNGGALGGSGIRRSVEKVRKSRSDYKRAGRSPFGCPRCGGFMVIEPCLDFRIQRCVQCGEVVDPIILRNRHPGSESMRRDRKGGYSRKAA